jgi:hypothetical protein
MHTYNSSLSHRSTGNSADQEPATSNPEYRKPAVPRTPRVTFPPGDPLAEADIAALRILGPHPSMAEQALLRRVDSRSDASISRPGQVGDYDHE